jgi:choice-of-anchor B domain-containing protein
MVAYPNTEIFLFPTYLSPMKLFLSFVVAGVLSVSVHSQTLCENGFAGEYACENVDLLAHLPPSAFGGGTTNEVWGWTDPEDGTEYVLLGKSTGVGFFDISNPLEPIYIGHLPTQTSNSLWRTLRTYQHYLFVGSEANNHGLQVFDLHRLRNVTNPPVNFTVDAHYNGFGRCHTLVIEEETGYLFACGTNTFSGGLHIVNIQNPLAPVIAGGYDSDGYTHEAQVMVYNGPDPDYQGRTIVFCYNGNNPANLTIVDATNPMDATTVSITFYPNSAYCHQGWLTPDGRFMLMNDELDELNAIVNQTRTLVWNVEDLDDPFYMYDFFGATEAIDHNLYIIGNIAFQSNYTAGFAMVDVRGLESETMQQVGFFDHYPLNNDNIFEANWMNYPYFESGVVPLTDIDNGMFLVRPNFIRLLAPEGAVCASDTLHLEVIMAEGFEGPVALEWSDLPVGATVFMDQTSYTSPDTAMVTIALPEAFQLSQISPTVTATGAHFSYSRTSVIELISPQLFFMDADGDGFGGTDSIWACTLPIGATTESTDCDDADATSYPGASGTGLNVDNNCNGVLDETERPFCADINGDNWITTADILLLMGNFGCSGSCPADVNNDGIVNVSDMISVVSYFGTYCD